MKANEFITSVLVLLIIFIVGLFALLLVINFVSGQDEKNAEEMSKSIPKISASDIPKDPIEREDIEWYKLLPSRQTNNFGSGGLNRTLSSSELDKLNIFISEFLRNYETFDPDRAFFAENNGRENPYKTFLRPFLSPDSVEEIISRSESFDLRGVCPFAESRCSNGSTWLGVSAPSVKILKDGAAYITVTGLVRYTSSDQFNSLKGKTGIREYAILLRDVDGRWKITRVVAETGDEVSL